MLFHSTDTAATIALGRRLALALKPGDVVAFYGDLGAGKTTMIKGICAGLGVTETVKSPSFVIVTEYEGRTGSELHRKDTKTQRGEGRSSQNIDRRCVLPVYHIDLYRLGAGHDRFPSGEIGACPKRNRDELEGIDLEEYLDAGGICLIEWAERAEGVLPERTIRVRMTVEGEGRKISVEGRELGANLRSTIFD